MDGLKKGFVLSEESKQELLDCLDKDAFPQTQATIFTKRKEDAPEVSRRMRGTTQRVLLHSRMFPEACKQFEEWVGDGTKVGQFDLLVYNKGSKFTPHTDNYSSVKDQESERPIRGTDRIHSTSTVLYKSDDLVGGDLVLFEDTSDTCGRSSELRDSGNVVDLEVGETVLFEPDRWHEVTEVENGTRICLICWLKHPSSIF